MATIKATINGRNKIKDKQLYMFYRDSGGVLDFSDWREVRKRYFEKYRESLYRGARLRLPYIGYLSVKRVVPYFVNLKRPSSFVHTRFEKGKPPVADKGPYADYSTPRLALEIDTPRHDWRTFIIMSEHMLFRKELLKRFRTKEVSYEVFKTKDCNKTCQKRYKGLYV